MRAIRLQELATKAVVVSPSLTEREQHILFGCLRQATRAVDMSLDGFEGDVAFSAEGQESIGGIGVSILCSLRGMPFAITISEALSLSLIDRFLKRAPTVISRRLIKEDATVLALIAALAIAELHAQGTWGLFLDAIRWEEQQRIPADWTSVSLDYSGYGRGVTVSMSEELKRVLENKARHLRRRIQVERLIGGACISLELFAEVPKLRISDLAQLQHGSSIYLGTSLPLRGECFGISISRFINLVGRHGRIQFISSKASFSDADSSSA